MQRTTGGDFTRWSIPSMGYLGHLIKINFFRVLGFSGFDSLILCGETVSKIQHGCQRPGCSEFIDQSAEYGKT